MKKIKITIFFLILINQTIVLAAPTTESVYIKDGECGVLGAGIGDEFTTYIPKDKTWIKISGTHVVDLDECSKIISKMNNEPQETTKATCKKLAETDPRWKGDIKVQWICEHEGFIWVDKIDSISLPGSVRRENKCFCSSIILRHDWGIVLKLSIFCLCMVVLYKKVQKLPEK